VTWPFAQYDPGVRLFVLHLSAKLLKVTRPIMLLTVFDFNDHAIDRIYVALVICPPGAVALSLIALVA